MWIDLLHWDMPITAEPTRKNYAGNLWELLRKYSPCSPSIQDAGLWPLWSNLGVFSYIHVSACIKELQNEKWDFYQFFFLGGGRNKRSVCDSLIFHYPNIHTLPFLASTQQAFFFSHSTFFCESLVPTVLDPAEQLSSFHAVDTGCTQRRLNMQAQKGAPFH